MSGRASSRRRSKTQRLIDSEEQDSVPAQTPTGSKGKRVVQKPKYLESLERSETPSSSRSRISTPTSSRATSRSPTPPTKTMSSSSRRKSSLTTSAPPSRASSRIKKTPTASVKTVNGRSGSATPLSRASRSSSVSSRKNVKSKPKVKTKLGRGYNPSLVNYKESEYHYGSDFDESEDDYIDDDAEEKDNESSDNESQSGEESDELVESDVDWPEGSSGQGQAITRSTTPVPFWLKTPEEEVVPKLELPKSSDDLLIDPNQAFKASGVYEVLRHYYLLLRLSLFRFEDFCAALASEEQSNLLSEVHIALLKATVRAEEKDNTQFGPMDHKDSINALLYFVDCMTWPEALRQYLAADPVLNAEPLAILNEYPEYPVAEAKDSRSFIDARISLLGFMADQFLTTNAVREDITNEGALATEDHCRVCHRLGDMVVCEMCNGVYHLACLDPPLDDVPDFDWQCHVCKAHQVEGVIDCVDDQEKSGTKIRHQALGFDRVGNKYWFLCRRIFIEEASGEARYYSSVPQFEELMETIDARYFESELCGAIEADRSEIERQMLLTEKLTAQFKSNSKKSFLELENQTIVKAQEDRQEKQLREERERREAADAIIRQAKEEEDAKRKAEDDERSKKEEERRREREVRLRKREENRGDGFPDSLLDDDIAMDTSAPPAESVANDLEIKEEEVKTEPMETEIKTEPPKDNKETIIVRPPPDAILANEPLRMTRKTVQEINQGTLFFKLGQEGTFRQYINQFTANASALSKVQANEERNKRTHMSHKFSLTDASAFRWMGQLFGTRVQLVNTLRQTMLQLESNVPLIFMHANWHLMRKPWIQALNSSHSPKEFARALTVIQRCIKPCLMVSVWTESLGHTQLKKITQQMRDDKKKMEKRERKENEDEAERLRPYMNFVKYTLGLKHQIAKQRGEEYRAHGQYGWLWLSSTRSFKPQDARTVGLRAGPHRLAVKYTDTRNNSFKIVLMEPKAFNYLLTKQEAMDSTKGKENDENNKETVEQADSDSKIGIEKKKLEQALKHARLERQVPGDELFESVVDVSGGLSNPTRILFPKVAKKTRYLDDFLARRLQLKNLEERRIELKLGKAAEASSAVPPKGDQAAVPSTAVSNTTTSAVTKTKEDGTVDVEGESDTKTIITSDLAEKTSEDKERDCKKFVDLGKKNIWNIIAKLKDSAKLAVPALVHRPSDLQCYAAMCNEKGCYSVTCSNYRKISPLVKEASTLASNLIRDGKTHGLELHTLDALAPLDTPDEAITKLQNLVKVLMKTKDEAEGYLSIGISAVAAPAKADEQPQVNGTPTASGDAVKAPSIESDEANKDAPKAEPEKVGAKSDTNVVRIYSSTDASGKLYLKRIQTVAESKKQSKIIKYPLAPHFFSPARKTHNILILAKHDAKRLARRSGLINCEGFVYSSKPNSLVWPYPCPRPSFKTAWLFRTACLGSIQTVAMQLRILWTCIKWDDIQTKPLSMDGKHQETTDSAITTKEIIKHRHVGRFMEKTEYYQRKVTIPLDVPRTKQEITPIRSGLRKRKREEAPQQTEPEVIEKWIPEEEFELWEIRAYRDRLDRDRNASVTRTRSGVGIREPQRLDPSAADRSRPTDLKAKMDEQLKQQAAVRVVQPNSQSTPAPTIIRQIQNPDGTVCIVRTTMGRPLNNGAQAQPQQQVSTIQPGTRKVFISKDGKIIGSQYVQQPATNATTKITLPSPVGGNVQSQAISKPTILSPAQASPQPQQKVQIVRSSDGKIQVRGLLPGQQLVQMPDGKLQIFSQPLSQPGAAGPTATIVQQAASPVTTSQSSRIVVHPGGIATTIGGSPQIINSPKPTVAATPTKNIVATPLTPGQAIPPGTTVFMSGGKTYCIPKATMTQANQQTQMTTATTTTPTLPVNPVPQQQLQQQQTVATSASPTTPTIGTVQAQSPAGTQKQMVEVKSLGQNTVTVKGNQMIVSGPDIAQAQLIAKQLSTGAARLATLNGKQVLISTQPTIIPSSSPATVSPTKTTPAGSVLPVKTEIPNNVKLPSEPLPPTAIKDEAKPDEQAAAASPVQVTAQLIQTPQGPRIVLQGIQGANLPKEQLLIIQQQVKEQLLKAQAEAKQQGKVPPTKIAIQLPPMAKPAAALPQQPSTVAPTSAPNATVSSPAQASVSRQVITTPSGQRVIVMGTPNPVQKQVVTVPQSNVPSDQEKPQQSLLMTSLTSPNKGQKQVVLSNAASSPDKFELTQEYIQETIQAALKKDNLSPEIEQKLLALQQNATDKSILINKGGKSEKKKLIDPATGEPMDDEWDGASYADRAIASRNRRKKVESGSKVSTPSAAASARATVNRNPRTVLNSTTPSSASVLAPMTEEKQKQLFQQRLNSALLRHKEQLKRDISKKRGVQEKELQMDIKREIEKIKGPVKTVTLTAGPPVSATVPSLASPAVVSTNNAPIAVQKPPVQQQQPEQPTAINIEQVEPLPPTSFLQNSYEVASSMENSIATNKRKRRDSDETNESTGPPRHKKKRPSSGQPSIKKDKVYCICKTKYDPKKFYVGCDVCNNWFHGSCVGISESKAKTMTEYICDECRNARENREIYCVCQQPYDETQFYIGCERCSDWFHGRCVGILQSEADTIDEYLCPRCDPNSKLNIPNQKQLIADDYEALKKLVKLLFANRCSIPFQQPVNPNEVPNYYKVVKEPMDLSKIEKKVTNEDYNKLCEFVGDIMRIFENCRFFNQPNSSIMKSAESLESFFAQKLVPLREKVASTAASGAL